MTATVEPMPPEELARFQTEQLRQKQAQRRFFTAREAEWSRAHAGEWALLVPGPKCLGFFETMEAGLEAGEEHYSAEDVFLRRVRGGEELRTASLGLLHGTLVIAD